MKNLPRKVELPEVIYGPAMPLMNSGNWNPDLHPRNEFGEFIYTDGGLHGRSPKGAGDKTGAGITIPPHPPGVDINSNMKMAWNLGANQNPYVALRVFKLLVQTGEPWDYKNRPTHGANPQYDSFGNFNYGATGTAFGLDPYTLQIWPDSTMVLEAQDLLDSLLVFHWVSLRMETGLKTMPKSKLA